MGEFSLWFLFVCFVLFISKFVPYLQKKYGMGRSFTSSLLPLPLPPSDKIRTTALCHQPSWVNSASLNLLKGAGRRVQTFLVGAKEKEYHLCFISCSKTLATSCLLSTRLSVTFSTQLAKISEIQTHPCLPTLLPTDSNQEPSTPFGSYFKIKLC